MPLLQNWVHGFEQGAGIRGLKFVLLVLALLALVMGYNVRRFKNLSNAEAMDAAQLARNLSEQKGYTTLFVRPFSLHLLQKAVADAGGPAADDLNKADQGNGLHPDLANAPLYPMVLAGLMKVMPAFKYEVAGSKSLWNREGRFWVYQPDLLITLFNQALFIVVVLMVFFLARRLFDTPVAWTSAILCLGGDIFWRFSISGLSTMLLMVVFLTLIWWLLLLEQRTREGKWDQLGLILTAAAIGTLVGLGGLTRYAFGWLIIPVLACLVLFSGPHRVVLCLSTLAAFALIMAPWVARNYHLSHTPFGTAGFALYETTPQFPEHCLQRSLNPDWFRFTHAQIWDKFLGNTKTILQENLPRLGGGCVGGFFLAALLISFKNIALSRLRYFLVLCLPCLIAAQAVGRTQLSEDSPVINSENLLVLLAPLAIIFGTGFFFILVDQMKLPIEPLRRLAIGTFCVLNCLPTILSFVSLRVNAASHPPCRPPMIQQTARWMKEDELMMSDVPWAVAWYGKQPCIWLTLDTKQEFSDLNNKLKPIRAVYLTPRTMNSRFYSDWARTDKNSWGRFTFDIISNHRLPVDFPLKAMPAGLLPEAIFLADSDRWAKGATP
jgi:hypothetical protein